MNATTFDSLAAARELKAAGVEGNQAEVFAEWMREASVVNQDDFATKADLLATKTDLEMKINAVEARLKVEMVTIANRNLVATLVALGVLFAALKLF